MAETDDGAPPKEAAENPRSNERRQDEIATVINATIMSEHRKRLIGHDRNTEGPKLTKDPIEIAHAILTGQNGSDRPLKISFDRATEKGHDVWMPVVDRPDLDGNMQEFEEAEIRLAGIDGVAPNGDLICYFEDINGNKVKKPGAEDDSLLKIAYTREEVLELQMRSEMATYSGFFPDSSQDIFQAAMGNRVIDESLDPAIESSAKESGMFTADQIRSLVDQAEPDASKRSPKTQQLLKSLDGKIILTREDFQQAVTVLGGPGALSARANEISTEIAKLQKTLSADPNNEIAMQQLEELQTEQSALGTAYNLFTDAQKEGKTPFDDYFDKAQNGELTNDQRVVLSAFLSGDTKPLAEHIQRMEGLSDKEKKDLLEFSKKAGKEMLWVLAALLAIPAAATAGGLYLAASSAQSRR